MITLTQTLRDRNVLDAVGGPAFVTHLFTFTPTAANARYYLDIVREKYILRQIIATCTECAARAYDEQGRSHDPLLGDVEQRVLAIGEKRFQNEQVPVHDRAGDGGNREPSSSFTNAAARSPGIPSRGLPSSTA